MTPQSKKGFTLIELLVVIAIIAILAVAVILTLNPAELLKQSRDSTRLSDMATLKSAISLYLADVSSPSLGSNTKCYLDEATSGNCNVFPFTAVSGASSVNGSSTRGVDGSGWIPVNFSQISSGAPIGNLPVDPVNSSQYFYAYIPGPSTNSTFKLVTKMESSKYTSGSNDVGSTDGGLANGTGGSATDWYETGTGLSL